MPKKNHSNYPHCVSPQLHYFLTSVKHGEVLDTRHEGHGLAVEAQEGCVGIFRSHALKGEADDAGRVEAHVKLQEHEAALAVLFHKFVGCPSGMTGPTVWMTYFAGRLKPGVILAVPVASSWPCALMMR